jgi:hypothetical protein
MSDHHQQQIEIIEEDAPVFLVGEKVHRIEDRAITEATVLTVTDESVEIAYAEGGSGWWPASALRKA